MADKVKATCPVCQMEFIQIESHLATAHKEHTTCQCSKCDKQFVREQNLNQHLVEYHNAKAKTNWCITCFKSFPSILDMKRHLSNVHMAKETFKCQVCNYSTTTKSSLRHHTFKMHKRENSKSVKCDVCHKMYASEFWMHRHKMLVHFDEKRYSCSTCDFKTNSTQVLTKHIAKEHDKAGPQFKCMICEVKFYLKGYLTSHMISHGEKTFKCPHCDHSSGYKNHLEDHIRFVHNKEKPFKCSKCPKAYSTKVMLVGHVSSFHEGKLNHKCKQCSYASGYIPNLTRHVQKYHQQKRYECPTCGLKMTEAGSLKEHIRKIHEDPEARPFECVICSKMFKCRTALYSHSKLHLNAKRKCDLCGFESIHLDIVNIHKRRVHQNVFFECDICHAKLITVANLRRHVREVHLMDRPKNVICDFCNYRCRFKSTMKNHLINNHIDGAKYPTTICTKEVKIILKDILTQVEFNKS